MPLPSLRLLVPLLALALAALGLAFAPPARAGDQTSNPFRGARLAVNQESDAWHQIRAWERSRPRDARLLRKLAEHPSGEWLGGWLPDVGTYVDWWLRRRLDPRSAVPAGPQAAATTTPTDPPTAFFVVYDLPHRDCSGVFSAGGARSSAAYRAWIDRIAARVGAAKAIFVVEPDGVPDSSCLPAVARRERLGLIAYATATLAALPNTAVYIDAGRSSWRKPAETAALLRQAGVAKARGFALNTTGYDRTRDELAYGARIGRALGGKHFIVNTSRNGRGNVPKRQMLTFQDIWCNQRKRGLGPAPTTETGHPLADAYQWILHPGYSDGPCHGGPRAGAWWPTYALELARFAAW